MNPERWQRLQELYYEVVALSPAERIRCLEEGCGSDLELRQEVETLLGCENKVGNFLEQTAIEAIVGAYGGDETAANETAADLDGAEVKQIDRNLLEVSPFESFAIDAAANVFVGDQVLSLIGRQIGPYRVLSFIGSGGMGQVYRAEHTKLGSARAIKVLPERLAAHREFLSRFEKEARLASSLNHPNIVTVHDIGQFDSIPYIVMELVEGKTLDELIGEAPMPLATVVAVAAQIASGLARAHEARVIHRDLKPKNIMVRPDGLVKILDFGLCKLIPAIDQMDPDGSASLENDSGTLPGTHLGTVPYMSPEQASGLSTGFETDQFSFGSILYEMLTGKRAFHRGPAALTLAAIIETEPEPIARIRSDVPPALQAVLKRCLAKKPEFRYGSTAELSAELDRIRNNPSEAGVAAPEPIISEKQLVVLPFMNIGNDPANQALCDGMAEILTSKLSELEQFQRALQVVPASEVRRERISSAREAREAFGANLVVSGSVQCAGDRIRLSLNLIDPLSLRQLNARSIDTEVRDISVLQDGVVLEVAELLEVRLGRSEKQKLMAGRTSVPGAYAFYLQGRGYLQRHERIENIENAITLFLRALQEDPQYALAQAGLGEAYWRKYERTKDSQCVAQARAACARATQLNDALGPVHVTLGMIYSGTGQYQDALDSLQKALRIDPLNADAYHELAQSYAAMGKLKEAESTYKKAIEMRRNYWSTYNNLGGFYYRLGRYAEAETLFRRVLELTPDNAMAFNNLGTIYYVQRQHQLAAAMFEKSVAISPKVLSSSNLGAVYFAQGRYTEAARVFERTLTLNDRVYQVWRNLASCYYWAPNEREKAWPAFQRAVEVGEEERRVNPRPRLIMHLADCYSMLGQREKALELLNHALSSDSSDVTMMFNAAMVYEQLSDRENALEWVRKALEHGYPRALVENSPTLEQLRADPRFQELRSAEQS
jgi:serine/threonine protein kinase/Tfp pilus assembly protein PilF